MKPHFVHLSTVHSPADVRIFLKMCSTLSERGYRVTYIVPAEASRDEAGVAIRALPPRTGARRRIANLFRVLIAAVRERGDVYQFHDPELLFVGAILKLLGRRVVYDVHEDVPKQILTKHWIPRWLRPSISRVAWCVEFAVARLCDGVVAATPSIARKFPTRRTVVVQNFPLQREIAPLNSTPFAERPANVVYVGGISAERGIRQVLAAMELVSASLRAKLVLAGSSQPKSFATELAGCVPSESVELRGWCSREEVQRLMTSARAGIVSFLPLPNHVEAQPNKLFEYLSAGLPVIASDFPLWREIIETHRCGILVDPAQPREIADAISHLLAHPQAAEEMGRRGRQAVEEKYNWDREAEVLLGLYERLLQPLASRRARQTAAKSIRGGVPISRAA